MEIPCEYTNTVTFNFGNFRIVVNCYAEKPI